MVKNKKRLFVASFITLLVAGLFTGLRASILGDWGTQFGFTKSELGAITGGGFVGFGIVILISSALAEKVGYGKLMWLAFALHILSAVTTIAATPIYGDGSSGNEGAYWLLYVGMFLFAIAWGICESIVNPLTATLYPDEKTHYLNILHAGWPAGLILGGLLAYFFASADARLFQVRWEILVATFLIPTFIYGYMLLGQKFPLSEARAAGATYSSMLKEFAAPIFLFLLFLQACIGYVELGTDSWIINIMQYVIAGDAFLLFIYTSALMFVLRFFAGPIVHRINPMGLLFASAVLATIGRCCHTRSRYDIRHRENFFLANHASCGIRALPQRWCPCSGRCGRYRNALGWTAGRSRDWLQTRLFYNRSCSTREPRYLSRVCLGQ